MLCLLEYVLAPLGDPLARDCCLLLLSNSESLLVSRLGLCVPARRSVFKCLRCRILSASRVWGRVWFALPCPRTGPAFSNDLVAAITRYDVAWLSTQPLLTPPIAGFDHRGFPYYKQKQGRHEALASLVRFTRWALHGKQARSCACAFQCRLLFGLCTAYLQCKCNINISYFPRTL